MHACREAANRARVHHALDAVRAFGTPVSFAGVVAETGLSGRTVTKHARTYLSAVTAELLGREVGDEAAFRAWTALYRSFFNWITASQEARAVQARWLRLVIEGLDRAGQPVTYTVVRTTTSATSHRVAAAIRAWEAETGRKAASARLRQPAMLAAVLPLIDPALHRMPLTFLDDSRAHRPLAESVLRMISGLTSPRLRNTAFFCLTLAETGHKNDGPFFASFSKFLSALDLADIDALDPDEFYPAFHDGHVLPEISTPHRAHWLRACFPILRRQEAYFKRLPPDRARDLAPFRLRPVTSTFFWHRSALNRQVSDEQQGRRKAATAAVHDKFYLFRNIAERRVNQLVRLRQAFRGACDRARSDPDVSFPVTFVYTEEAVTPAGSARTVTHRFRLWDGHALRRAAPTRSLRRNHTTRGPARSRGASSSGPIPCSSPTRVPRRSARPRSRPGSGSRTSPRRAR
jgi:hypothetical protein